MQEVFYEETATIAQIEKAKKKYVIGRVLMYVSYAFAFIWALINFFNFDLQNIIISIVFFIIPTAIFILIGFFIGKFSSNFYAEYDYSFVSGNIRFSKIISNNKRINIANFECNSIEKIGLYDSDEFKNFSNYPNIKNEFLTSNDIPNDSKNFYYIFATVDGEKRLFTIESSKQFLKLILSFSNTFIFEKEVLSEIK